MRAELLRLLEGVQSNNPHAVFMKHQKKKFEKDKKTFKESVQKQQTIRDSQLKSDLSNRKTERGSISPLRLSVQLESPKQTSWKPKER